MNFSTLALGTLLGKRLPRHAGRLTVPCREPIEIWRDEWGVAYVDARSEHDAWFGLGFCHAQDRMGQLEIMVRLVRGTLASIAGPDALGVDRAARLIGVHRAARAQLECFDADVRAQLGAYTAGINAALAGERPSHEHTLLRTIPTPWEPADVVASGLMMCCFLPSNWDAELARLLILAHDGPAAVAALDPAYPMELPVTYPPNTRSGQPSADYVLADLARLREFIGTSGGSNAWAVSGAKTRSGRPLLANDPHLPATLPNVGYLARVKCPSFAAAGVSIVGIPAFLSGHNGHAAWGCTAAQVDNTDLFLEELGPDGKSVREGDRFVPCALHTELIEVRGRAPERLEVLTTARGPIVARANDPETSIFAPLPFAGRRANALSFAATWLRRAPTRALLRAHTVKSFADFRAACRAATGCAYSVIYADPETVGWVVAAEIPSRRRGFGSLPMPGWDLDGGWKPEIAAASELLHASNPSAGFLCTANNKLVSDRDAGAFLGHDFLDGYRQQRITSELSARSDWSVESMLALQLDVLSLPWQELEASILALEPAERHAARALELLRSWDGRLAADSAAASVFQLFLAEVCKRVCQLKAPNSWRIALGQGVMKLIAGTTFNTRRTSFVVRLIRERPSGYFSSWPKTLLDALGASVRLLDRRFGADPAGWGWGRVRPLPVSHRLGGKPPLDRVFDVGKLPGYGDGGTVNQAGFEFWNPLRHSTVTAHVRSVIDVGDFDASRFVLLGGQSGNPLSRDYKNLIPLWQNGEGVPIHFDDRAVRGHARSLLTLTPPALQLPAPRP